MEIFWRLVLGHLIGDFTLQTNYVAAWKRRNLVGLFVHCATHPILYALLLWRYIGEVWIEVGTLKLTGCWCILLIFVTHLIEDEWRIWSVLRKGAPDNTFFYIWDQVIHYTILFIMSPVIEGATSKFGFIHYPPIRGALASSQAAGLNFMQRYLTISQPENWVVIGILFVIVTHFTTVTIYFIEKDFFGGDYPATDEKYISMAERLVVMGCFLLPGVWWVCVIGIWLLRGLVYKLRRIYDFSWTSLLVGNGTAVVCGILARAIFYS